MGVSRAGAGARGEPALPADLPRSDGWRVRTTARRAPGTRAGSGRRSRHRPRSGCCCSSSCRSTWSCRWRSARLDPIFLTADPVYNPLQWDTTPFRGVVTRLFTAGLHRAGDVASERWSTWASRRPLCLLIGYPVAYFVARHAGRTKTFFLVAFIAPFWISYMMRMFAWVNLLQEDGYVNRILEALGVIDQPELWLSGKPSTVVFGLVYGYIPFMILPLFGTLDRIDRVDDRGGARPGRRPGARRSSASRSRCRTRASWPAASSWRCRCSATTSRRRCSRARADTAMFGNLIVSSIQSSLVNTGAALVVVMVVLLIAADALLPAQHERRAGAGGTMSGPRRSVRPSGEPSIDRVGREPVGAGAVPVGGGVRATWRGRSCPVFIAVAFSFNAGKAQTTWQGFSADALVRRPT